MSYGPPLQPHGTEAAYKRHLSQKTTPCSACKGAHADTNRARNRALTKLARRYPGDFLKLFQYELQQIYYTPRED